MGNRRRMTEVKAQTVQENKTIIDSDIAKSFIERGEVPQADSTALHYQMIPLEKLRSWQEQPRTFFDPEALNQLAKTIEREGFKYPLLVRPIEDGYEVVAGERRFLAGKMAKKTEAPCIVETLDDQQALSEALTENLLREDLNPIEVLNSLLRLLCTELNRSESEVVDLLNQMKYQYEQSNSQDINILFKPDSPESIVVKVFERFGYQWYSYVCNQLKLRNLPDDVYEVIAQGKIEYSKGLRFKSIKDETLRQSLLEQAINEGWTQKVIAEKIKEAKANDKSASKKITPSEQVTSFTSRIKKAQPWQKNPAIWKKIQTRLKGIDDLLKELEQGEENQSSDSQVDSAN
jgi:ParB family chromosome partitioning protein